MLRPTIGRRTLLKIGSLPLILLIVSVGACQTYNFEPFTPSFYKQYVQVVNGYAITVKPNVMILFDKSGSMEDKSCPVNCGPKIEEARQAMVSFMNSDAGTLARFGLTFFPDTTPRTDFAVNSTCGVPAEKMKVTVELPTAGNNITGNPTDENTEAALRDNANLVRDKIQSISPGGGTPTATAFQFLENYQGFNGVDRRSNYILLVTDGLPNCNPHNPPDNPNSNPNNVCKYSSDPDTAKKWTSIYSNRPPPTETDPQKIADYNEINAALDKCDCQNGAPTSCLNRYDCSSGCLNLPATTAEISKLRTKSIKTIVVGFGTAVTADTPKAAATAINGLSAMARAGGFPRACPNGTDAECGTGDSCDTQTNVCKRPFYQVANGAELAKTLSDIISALPLPCQFQLQAQPSDPSLLAVIVNGTVIPRGPETWIYKAGVVTFQDGQKICTDIMTATNFKPVKIEFRILQQVK